MTQDISISFLPTLEDHVNMTIERLSFFIPKENRIILRVIGIIAVMCAMAGFLNLRENIIQLVCWIILTAAGLYALSYYDVIRPYIERNKAIRFYKYHKDDIYSKSLSFSDGILTLKDRACTIRIPVDFIYKIRVTKNTLFIFYDKADFCYVPKRMLDSSQIKALTEAANKKITK